MLSQDYKGLKNTKALVPSDRASKDDHNAVPLWQNLYWSRAESTSHTAVGISSNCYAKLEILIIDKRKAAVAFVYGCSRPRRNSFSKPVVFCDEIF